MALTLDGMIPAMGGSSSSGAALGAGGGILGGGIAGLLGGALAGGLLGGGRGWGGYGGGYGAPAATAAVATDIVLNPAFQSLQTQVTGLSSQISHNSLSNQIEHEEDETTRGIDRLDAQMTTSFSDINNRVADLSTAQASANFTTLMSINGLGRDVTAAQNQAALQQLNSFNNLTTTTLQGFNSQAMQTQNATNQIIAQGTANAAAMAQCCCEIKSLIQSDGNATRALINDLNVQNLRDQLAAANNQVSNNAQNQYLLSTILTHLHPTNVIV